MRCLKYTDIKQAPWYVVDAHDKKRAATQLHSPLVESDSLRGPYRYQKLELPSLQEDNGYMRPPMTDQTLCARTVPVSL